MYINRYIYEGGNPFLLPSLSHNITLGTTYKWVYLSAGYQYIKDAIISFTLIPQHFSLTLFIIS